MNNVNTSFLLRPQPEKEGEKYNGQGWGYLDPNNESVYSCWKTIQEQITPRNIVEIGMFAGHSTATMLTLWPKANIISYDPGSFARKSNNKLRERFGLRFEFRPFAINEYPHLPTDVDLMFIDGSHKYEKVKTDIEYAKKIKPKYILFDNIELSEVRKAVKEAGFMSSEIQPQYLFYTCEHKGIFAPGILLFLKL